MTDGQVEDAHDRENNYQHLNQSIQDLEKTLSEKTNKCEFHTIGLKKEHDPILLERVTNLGSKNNGTYQYFSKIEDGEEIFENLKGLVLSGENFQI